MAHKIGTDELFRRVGEVAEEYFRKKQVICADCAHNDCESCKWDICQHPHYWSQIGQKSEADLLRDAGISLREGSTEDERQNAYLLATGRYLPRSPFHAGYRR